MPESRTEGPLVWIREAFKWDKLINRPKTRGVLIWQSHQEKKKERWKKESKTPNHWTIIINRSRERAVGINRIELCRMEKKKIVQNS